MKTLSFYIDSVGNELDFGRFEMCLLPKNGWIACKTKDKRYFFDIENNSNNVVIFDDIWVSNIFSGGLLKYSMGENRKYGVFSLVEQRYLIPAIYKDIFKYDCKKGHFSVLTSQDHLQIIDANNKILQDFGQVCAKRPILLSEDEPLLIADRKKSNYNDKTYECIDVWTGLRQGSPFYHIGKMSESLRYLHGVDQRYYFVNNSWEPVFELPKHTVMPYDFGPLVDINFIDGHASIENSYVLNKRGEIIIHQNQYPFIKNIGENRLYVFNNKRKGAIIDTNCNPITEYIYSKDFLLEKFRERSICLWKKINKKEYTGCIDPDGNEIIPFKYQYEIYGFKNGMGIITVDADI